MLGVFTLLLLRLLSEADLLQIIITRCFASYQSSTYWTWSGSWLAFSQFTQDVLVVVIVSPSLVGDTAMQNNFFTYLRPLVDSVVKTG